MKIRKHIILFAIGGAIYYVLEIVTRGYSHYTMFICGGICFLCCGCLNESKRCKMSFVSQMVVAAAMITAVELVTGCVVNLWLKMDVWDYSHLPYNFLGQVCLFYSFVWFFVSALAILIDDWLRWKLFGEKLPQQKWL